MLGMATAVRSYGRGLALACHPLPTLAVTAISAALAGLAGNRFATAALVTAAVFAGQLSIGWSNDRIDAARDSAAHRGDKPVAAGSVPGRVIAVAAGSALAAAIALSLALGWRAGCAALIGVACGWSYNLGLKSSAWSWLPYAVAFGSLPATATLALTPSRWPAAWAVLAGALIGVAAHFANVLPDFASDAATGVRGLPHRVGQRASVVVGPVLLLGATTSIVLGGAARLGAGRWIALGVAAGLASIAVLAGLRRPASRLFFLATVAVAVADVALFGFSGGHLA
jgi:4-hydroxybenzoate polyprenyltransferase